MDLLMQPFRRLKISPLKLALLLTLLFLTACSQTGPLPESPLLRALERKSGRIVYLGTDWNIHIVDQTGGNQVQITNDANVSDRTLPGRQYGQPVWSPDSTKVAYPSIEQTVEGQLSFRFFATDIESLETTEIFNSTTEAPVDLFWSPNNEDVGLRTVISDTGEIQFRVVNIITGAATDVGGGGLYFWDWAPNGLRGIAHVAGMDTAVADNVLSAYTISGGVREQPLTAFKPFRFNAPDWSPTEDRILFAADDFGEGILYVSDPSGSRALELVFFRQAVSFGWSPDGTKAAYIANQSDVPEPSGIVFGELGVIDLSERGDPLLAPDETIIAFFWSPDNEQIAYFRPSVPEGEPPPQGNILFELKVMDIKDGESRLLETFQPSPAFLQFLLSFDQQSRGNTIWSPDGENLVITAMAQGDIPIIVTVASSGGIQARILVEGFIGTWSWE